jgi:molybdate transport system substrate-binding protein
MTVMRTLILFLIAQFVAISAYAGEITVAAAADLKWAMEDVSKAYIKDHPDDKINVIYGSSGKFFAQLQNGAPFDMYFSADIAYPRELAAKGLAASEVKLYAIGRIVLWSPSRDASKMTLASLAEPKIQHISIANPKHAPYGKRAEEALKAAGVWAQVEPRLVYGENIAQAAQFVQTGNAEVGVIALSLALSPQLAASGGYYLIPDKLHEPLEQGFIITQRAAANPLAKRFADFMNSQAARAIMIKYGFVLPAASGR